MATFIYVPVSTPEMTGFVQDWNNGRQARGKAAYQVIANDSSARLMQILEGPPWR